MTLTAIILAPILVLVVAMIALEIVTTVRNRSWKPAMGLLGQAALIGSSLAMLVLNLLA